VDIFKDIEEEQPGDYELIDDLEYANDEDFHRLHHVYENELDYVRSLLLKDPKMRQRNYMYDETYFLPMEKEGRINTSAGDLDLKEFAQMELDDLMDYFYVWNDWDRDARFYRNAALTLMAKEGPGEFAKMNEQTEKVANEICDDLEIAHEKDPTLPLPVKEYILLTTLLGREDKLKDCPKMEQEAIQYRSREVYHLFSNCKVVAPGMAERSFDPVTNSMNLMAPFKDEGDWSWLLQASTEGAIIDNKKNLMEQDPVHEENGTIWMDDWCEDGFYVVEAAIRKDEDWLYLHAVCASAEEVPYMKACMRQSGFAQ
jgi:hypothetical protein